MDKLDCTYACFTYTFDNLKFIISSRLKTYLTTKNSAETESQCSEIELLLQ